MTTDGTENATEPDELLTLREAAERASRSVTTLRRYIRSGRLHAEKRYGRFGPEYFVSVAELTKSGFTPVLARPRGALQQRPMAIERTPPPMRTPLGADAVPIILYQELQLKHEQLLVQYGMIRAGGLRAIELGAEAEELRGRLSELATTLSDARTRFNENERQLQKEVHEARLELEGRGIEIAALNEKVRTLEMLTRNAATSESIEDKFRHVAERNQRVQQMEQVKRWPSGQAASATPPRDEPGH